MNVILLCIYLAGSAICILRWQSLSVLFRLVATMFWLTSLVDVLARLTKSPNSNNLWLYHIYNLALSLLFGFIFQQLLGKQKQWKWLKYFFVALLVWGLLNVLFVQSLAELPSYLITPLNLLVIISALLVLRYMLDEPESRILLKQSRFWLCAAFLIYQSSSLFYWTIYNYLSFESGGMLLQVNVLMCLIYYSALGWSVELNARENIAHG
ncbi:MAG: hypothetical protein ACKVOR_05230 [Flavobacteriales bacterium]